MINGELSVQARLVIALALGFLAGLERETTGARSRSGVHAGVRTYAILSLLATMGVGLWLVWPVSDHWAGSGEEPSGGPTAQAPPPRLAPDRAPLEPRS